ncbi:CTD phosphatase Fcp1, partial [Kickxella alabastrina]
MEAAHWLQVPRRHAPAKVVDILVNTGDQIQRDTPILTYEYREKYMSHKPEAHDPELMKALRKSVDAEGFIKKREYLRSPFEGKVTQIKCVIGDVAEPNLALVQITVPCSHAAVFNGLCGMCGKDVSGIDTSGMPESRANIDMFHDANGLKVSYEMAASIEADVRDALWDQKKLSLIIDLDQTIIHADATADPKFQERLLENYKGPPGEPAPSGDGPRGLPSDIGAFYLPEDPRQYYVKMRPGLRDFLERVSKLYEMHIYTMGTRSYANAVAHLIDPEQRYFNGRILSRDESGSMTKKTLKRLFPVDTSMVVILDDRGDVWEWSPNLICVYAYEFFGGVGDINAGLLAPKQVVGPQPTADADADGDAEKLSANSAEALLASLPDSTGNHPAESGTAVVKATATGINKQSAGLPTAKYPKMADKDRELFTLQNVLTHLHKSYYDVLDPSHQPPLPDIAEILSSKKRRVFEGLTILFTAAIPINHGGKPPQKSDLWLWAQSFGARCELELSSRTTHVVAGKPGTEKVHLARRMQKKHGPGTACPPIVVMTNWLLDSIFRWERLDETTYLWYPEDEEVVKLARKQASQDSGQSLRQGTAMQRLKQQADRDANAAGYESANTTDVEAELEIEEAELQEHEAEVETFVQTIDWDDLERELMEDSESDDGSVSGRSRPQTPGASGGSSGSKPVQSRTASAVDLRHVAIKQAAKQRANGGDTGDISDMATPSGDNSVTDSSDVYGDGSSGGDGSGNSSADNNDDEVKHESSGMHRMKRRKTSVDDTHVHHAPNKNMSKLAASDGNLDINTNTDDSESDSNTSGASKPQSVRSRLANKLGISLNTKSILDDNGNTTGQRRKRSESIPGDSSGDDYFAKDDQIDAPLFKSIESDRGDYEAPEHESDFENAEVKNKDAGANKEAESDGG